jgi:sec-independent protein translocase protein TatA
MPEGADWIIILLVVAVLFGGTQIPKLARSLGQAQKEFKSGLKEGFEPDPELPEAPAAKVVEKVVEQPVVAEKPQSRPPSSPDGADNLT